MDVALMVYSLRGGGVERMRLHLARALARRQFKVDLVVARNDGVYSSDATDGFRVINLNASSWKGWLFALIKYLRHERPKVLLSAMDVSNLIAIWAKQLSRVHTRVIIGTHNTLSAKTPFAVDFKERHLLIPLIRMFYQKADGIVAISRGVADDLARLSKLPRERIEVIHNPVVTPELLEHARFYANRCRRRGDAQPLVLAAGRLVRQKDFAVLIRAFARVRKERPASLTILGEGPDRPTLDELAQTLGVRGHVEFPGFVRNTVSYMASASVFVLSSAWEGFGNVVVEALACGCPVVSTDCPNGPREILEDGKYGYLVRVGDDEALAQAIVRTLDHPPASGSLESRAMDFHVDKIIRQYLAIMGLPTAI